MNDYVDSFDGEAECPECLVVICAWCQGQLDLRDDCRGKHKSHCSYQGSPALQEDDDE